MTILPIRLKREEPCLNYTQLYQLMAGKQAGEVTAPVLTTNKRKERISKREVEYERVHYTESTWHGRA